MDYRMLGRSGFKVPVLSLGTGTFGGGGELFKAFGSTDAAEATRLVDVALKDSPIRRETRALIIAMRGKDGVFSYNPEPSIVMREGWTLIAIGETDNIRGLRALAGEPTISLAGEESAATAGT